MRVANKKPDMAEADMTPMIDMVFNLIAFFMVLINFGQTESHDLVVLPSSILVKPPEAPLPFPIILHLGEKGAMALGGEQLTIQTMKPFLNREIAVLKAKGKTPADATLIIRAHKNAAAGFVQDVIAGCQDLGFDTFALRVQEDLNKP
jgi:biopolymer transport protein ExbD